jgi:50S ribosomal subunit-associated GTPase HflX
VNVSTGPIADAEDSIAELRQLAQSAGVIVLDEMIQRRGSIDPRTILGKGKLDELLIRAMQLGADAIIFDRELQAAQVRLISDATDLKVIDRSQLILDIFAQRAQSHEGKIRSSWPNLNMLPRLVMGQNSRFRDWPAVSADAARRNQTRDRSAARPRSHSPAGEGTGLAGKAPRAAAEERLRREVPTFP